MKKLISLMALCLLCISAYAQQAMLSGRVTDADGQPVIGAVIYYPERNNVSTMTDDDGKYTIVLMKDKKLVYSCFGLKDVTVQMTGKTVVNVTMQSDQMVIDDAVVIGYGQTSRKDLTGSITSVKADELRKSGSSNVFGSLQGRVAGLSITSQSGEPGSGYQIKIRGNNSINSGTTPLFVIDGMQMDISSGEVATSSTTGQATYDPLSFLNPNDIESIEVLKDASATAIYGAQGANGVVIVTTKSGSSSINKTNVTFDASVGIATVPKKLDLMTPQDYIDYRFARKDYGYDGYGIDTDGDDIPDTPRDASLYPQFEWQDVMYRNAVSQNYNLSMSGVVGKGTQIAASLGYLNQQGLIKNNDYSRYNGRLKIDHKINDKLKMGMNVTYGRDISNGAVSSGGGLLGSSGLIQLIYLERPVQLYTPSDTDYIAGYNRIDTMISDQTYRQTVYQRTMGNVYLNWDIIEGLTFRASASGSVSDSRLMEYYSSKSRWGRSKEGYGNNKSVGTWNYNASATLTYKKSWDKIHNFDAMVGAEMSTYHSSHLALSAYKFVDESTMAFNIGKGGVIEAPSQSISESSRMSAFARVNYNYRQRYYLTLNFRSDGSSKFYPGHRVGYFPSASLAWRINEEPWMQGAAEWMDNFKLRASAGASGNDRVSTYAALAQLGMNYYAGGGSEIMGLAPTSAANPNLKWETTYQYNVGLDLNLFDYRLNFTGDVYYKDTRDMLYKATLSAQSGYTDQWQNLGRVDNRGIELALTSHNIDNRDFKWTTNITFDLSRNRVRDIGGVEYTSVNISGGMMTNDISRIIVGQPIGVGYGYVWDGNYQLDDFIITDKYGNVLPSEAVTSSNYNNFTYELKEGVPSINSMKVKPGDRKYKDLPTIDTDGDGIPDTGDGEITTEDRTVISNSNPDFTMGMGNTLSWKGIELSFFFEGVFGREILNEYKLRSESGLSGGTAFNRLTKAAWDGHWTPENGSQTYARLLNQSNNYVSSYYVEDASFIRLKTISLAYNFSEKLLRNIKFKGLKLYFNVDNAYVWTNYSGMDPDVSSSNSLFTGFDRLSYPKARTYTFGLTATF